MYVRSFVNVPWMSVPFEVISWTVPALTCWRKNGLYGTRTRDCGSMARLLRKTLSPRMTRKKTIHRVPGLYQGRPAPAGGGPCGPDGVFSGGRPSAWSAIARPRLDVHGDSSTAPVSGQLDPAGMRIRDSVVEDVERTLVLADDELEIVTGRVVDRYLQHVCTAGPVERDCDPVELALDELDALEFRVRGERLLDGRGLGRAGSGHGSRIAVRGRIRFAANPQPGYRRAALRSFRLASGQGEASIDRDCARASRHHTSSYMWSASQIAVTSPNAASAGIIVATGSASRNSSAATNRPRLSLTRRSVRIRIPENGSRNRAQPPQSANAVTWSSSSPVCETIAFIANAKRTMPTISGK